MWEPRRLTTLWAFTACYRDSFTYTCTSVCVFFESFDMSRWNVAVVSELSGSLCASMGFTLCKGHFSQGPYMNYGVYPLTPLTDFNESLYTALSLYEHYEVFQCF
jgi:hypothetical protein